MSVMLEFDFDATTPEDVIFALIEHAADLNASDLFLCADEYETAVKVRHLGLLQDVCELPSELGRRCVAYIKAATGMDISEKRRPQENRWLAQLSEARTVDLRISTLPTLHGEDFAMRILDRETQLLQLDGLGMRPGDLSHLLALLSNPGGLILVTGPTGSGKTTTLYACLQHLHNGERKINTIEDPVEYAIDGIRQSQINPRIDVGFAELLLGVLRQAPDVIMIGEVRDPETAQITVRAANSGHLVLATMHAPTAAAAIPTLINLGVHPQFLASSLLGVVAQRLIRVLCPECKIGFDLGVSSPSFDEIRDHLEPGQGQKLYGPQGCPACRHTGFIGQTGIFQVMPISHAIRTMITERLPAQALRARAQEDGMMRLRHAALLKVAQGETSVEEVFRAIPVEYLSEEED